MAVEQPKFKLGFKALADLIPDIVGQPLEDERHNAENGDGLQGTTNGLLVWRKADNWTAFTDGYRTWINGPNGLQERLNTERFDWETRPATAYRPSVLYMPLAPLSDTFSFFMTPKGFVLHSTRSGVSRPAQIEFPAAASYETNRTDGCGCNATIGDDTVAIHAPWGRWAWHARKASRYYISLEIAQGTSDDPISDAEVRAIVWAVEQARDTWPQIPLVFRTHAELEQEGETGLIDGKTDVFPYGDPRADELRAKILTRLAELGLAV